MIIAEIGDFNRFDSLIKSWLMPDYLLLHTSQDNLMAHTPTWKSVVPDIYYALYNAAKFLTGIQHSLNNGKEPAEGKHYNVAISHAVKSWFEIFTISFQPAIHRSVRIFQIFLSTSNDALFHTVLGSRTLTEFKIYLKYIFTLFKSSF